MPPRKPQTILEGSDLKFKFLSFSFFKYYGSCSWVFESKEAGFEPPRLAKIFFLDLHSVTLNYQTPRLMSTCTRWRIGWAWSLVGEGQTPPSDDEACWRLNRDQDTFGKNIDGNVWSCGKKSSRTLSMKYVLGSLVYEMSPISAWMLKALRIWE